MSETYTNARGETVEGQRCEAMVWDPGYWHQHSCSRKATTQVGGKQLCTQHAKKEASA